jgi:peptidoglycan-associated lipoprotein
MRKLVGFGLTGLLIAGLIASGCARRPATSATAAPAPTGAAITAPGGGATGPTGSTVHPAAGTPRASDAGRSSPMAGRPTVKEFEPARDLVDVYFDFDKYEIRPADARALESNARWLRANRDLILIEGHCDARGTNEYNVALGERRAKSTMDYLVAQGVAASRITIVSYGEERPQCAENAEACWSKNRRAHFLVKAQ